MRKQNNYLLKNSCAQSNRFDQRKPNQLVILLRAAQVTVKIMNSQAKFHEMRHFILIYKHQAQKLGQKV